MKIKLKNILMISFLAVAGIFGVSSAVINNQVKETPVAEKAEAADDTSHVVTKIYLKLNSSYWGSASAYYSAYLSGGKTNTSWPGVFFNSGNTASGSSEISVDISAYVGFKHIAIIRWDGGNKSNEWGRWNYYSDGTYGDPNHSLDANTLNYFTNHEWDWGKGNGDRSGGITSSLNTSKSGYNTLKNEGWYIVGTGLNYTGSSYSTTWSIDQAIASDASAGSGNVAKWTGVTFALSTSYGASADQGFKLLYYHHDTKGGYFDYTGTNPKSALASGTKADDNGWFDNKTQGNTSTNLMCKSAGTYNVYLNNSYQIWISKSVNANIYTYINGTASSKIRTDSVSTDDAYSPTAPTVTGYTFSSWKSGSGTGSTWTSGSYLTGDIDLYATYTVGVYTVTLQTNGGTINSGNVTSYTYGVGAQLPSNVTKNGYAFGGWYDNGSFTGNQITSISTTDTGNKTFYAKWISEGWYGGETFYLVDEYPFFSSNHIRVYLWDTKGNSYFAGPYTTKTAWKDSGHDVYVITIPEYEGTDSCGWSQFIVFEYKPAGDSDEEIVAENIVHQTGDLSCDWWGDRNTWYATGISTDGWNHIDMTASNVSGRSGFVSGSVCYFDPNNWTITTGNHYAIRFYGAVGFDIETYSAVVVMDYTTNARQVCGTDFQLGVTSTPAFFTHGVWECEVPYATGSTSVVWNRYDVVELKSGSTTWSTTNIVSGSGDLNNQVNYNHNVIEYFEDDPEYDLTPTTRYTCFVKYFNYVTQESTGVCRMDGSTDKNELKTVWNNCKIQFPLDADAQELFTETSPTGTNPENKAASRYDYIVHAYGSDTTNFSDFAGRVAAGTSLYGTARGYSPFVLFGSEDNFSTIIIIISSSVALLSVTALSILVIRKRKIKESE